MRVSYLEIYNENIKDLLTADDTNLDLREDKKKISVAGLSEIIVNNSSEVMALLKFDYIYVYVYINVYRIGS